LPNYLQKPFASHCPIPDFLLVIVSENVFFACLFIESIKCQTFATKPALLRILTRVSRQFTEPTMLDSALRLCCNFIQLL